MTTIIIHKTQFKSYKTTVTVEVDKIKASRVYGTTIYKFDTMLSGGVQDMLSKVQRVAELDDETFKLFSEIDI